MALSANGKTFIATPVLCYIHTSTHIIITGGQQELDFKLFAILR